MREQRRSHSLIDSGIRWTLGFQAPWLGWACAEAQRASWLCPPNLEELLVWGGVDC